MALLACRDSGFVQQLLAGDAFRCAASAPEACVMWLEDKQKNAQK